MTHKIQELWVLMKMLINWFLTLFETVLLCFICFIIRKVYNQIIAL